MTKPEPGSSASGGAPGGPPGPRGRPPVGGRLAEERHEVFPKESWYADAHDLRGVDVHDARVAGAGMSRKVSRPIPATPWGPAWVASAWRAGRAGSGRREPASCRAPRRSVAAIAIEKNEAIVRVRGLIEARSSGGRAHVPPAVSTSRSSRRLVSLSGSRSVYLATCKLDTGLGTAQDARKVTHSQVLTGKRVQKLFRTAPGGTTVESECPRGGTGAPTRMGATVRGCPSGRNASFRLVVVHPRRCGCLLFSGISRHDGLGV